jgi:hypothetical protein
LECSKSKLIQNNLEVSVSVDAVVRSVGEEAGGTLRAAVLEGGGKAGVDSDSRNNNRGFSLPLANQVSVGQSGVAVGVAVETGGTLGAAVLEGGGKTGVDSDSRNDDGWFSLPLAKVVSVDAIVGSIGEEARGTLGAAVLEGGGKAGVDSNSGNDDGWFSLPLAQVVSVSKSRVSISVAIETGGALGASVNKGGGQAWVDGDSGHDRGVRLGDGNGGEGKESSLWYKKLMNTFFSPLLCSEDNTFIRLINLSR